MKTLLLIDDDNDLLTMLKRGFEKLNYICDIANNQQEFVMMSDPLGLFQMRVKCRLKYG